MPNLRWDKDFGDSHHGLKLRYSPDRPPHLSEINKSLDALSRLHKMYFQNHLHIKASHLPNLSLKNVYEGSLVFDLISQTQNLDLVNIIDGANHVIDFGKHLKDGFMFFLKRKKEAPKNLSSEEATAFADMLLPTTHSGGGGMNIIAKDGGTNNVTINLGIQEAREIRSKALNWAGLQRLPAAFTRDGVIFRWFQAREESLRRGGDMGIIECISEKPVNVGFSNNAVKEDMLGEPLFKMAYLVDIHGQSIEGSPIYYRIMRVEDKFLI